MHGQSFETLSYGQITSIKYFKMAICSLDVKKDTFHHKEDNE